MGCHDQQWVGGEDPHGGHAGDSEGLGGPHDEVDAAGGSHGEGAVQPEEDDHGVFEPRAGVRGAHAVDGDVH